MASCTSEISKDWEKSFPELKKFALCRFYQVVGPFICGIRLSGIASLKEYRPSLEIIGLWDLENDNFRKFFNTGFMFESFGYTIGFFNIGVKIERHSTDYLDIVALVKEELKFEFGHPISIEDIFLVMDFWTKKSIGNKSQGFQVNYLTFKFFCSIYVNDEELKVKVLNEIKTSKNNWDLNQFDMAYGSFDKWFNSLIRTDRDDFIRLIEKNKSQNKINNLPFFELLS